MDHYLKSELGTNSNRSPMPHGSTELQETKTIENAKGSDFLPDGLSSKSFWVSILSEAIVAINRGLLYLLKTSTNLFQQKPTNLFSKKAILVE